MSQITVICCSCGNLFSPDPDNHNLLYPDNQQLQEFYACDECLARPLDEDEDIITTNLE